ncbi:P-loop containing nucleoside triphosphate hydrolase protein [Hysterangium stoloniferum]|nr:P-loop containing nucleoside triphosphate hydrolase protein [Hysterangium stoloniferum]
MDLFKSVLGPLGGSGVIDTMKLVVLGGTVETARRVSSSAWTSFVNSFFLTAHFSEEDYPFDWLMLWLSKRPEWQRSREFETTTRTHTIDSEEYQQDVDEDAEGELAPGKQTMRVVFQPTFDTTHTIYYRKHWLRVRRSKKSDGSDTEMLSISVVARSNSVLKQLVLQAKKEYEADAIHRIQIYFADSHGSWRWTDSRHKRPMSSIVLDPGVKEMLLDDTRDFLRSEKWYADRGIPFRRGYLLHGVPGSGKSSLIHAIAGELALDIYVVSLSSSWINDSTLNTLMGRVPARCILLLEDLDAAFTRSVTRDGSSTGLPTSSKSGTAAKDSDTPTVANKDGKEKEEAADVNTLSLSGLLNSLDGVAAAEGRILFATTNHLERLDPALSRPGRMDVWVEFKNASKWQCEQLFRNFFPSSEDPLATSSSAGPGPVDDLSLEDIDIPGLTCEVLESDGSRTGSSTAASSVSGRAARSEYGMAGKEAEASTPPAFPPPLQKRKKNAPLDPATLARLAMEFAEAIPEKEFSVAALQGCECSFSFPPLLFCSVLLVWFFLCAFGLDLLKNKSRPEAAAKEAAQWVITERELRERLQREKEEKERKEKIEVCHSLPLHRKSCIY